MPSLHQELEVHRTHKEQYEQEAAAEAALWREAQALRATQRAEKHRVTCEDIAWQVIARDEGAERDTITQSSALGCNSGAHAFVLGCLDM